MGWHFNRDTSLLGQHHKPLSWYLILDQSIQLKSYGRIGPLSVRLQGKELKHSETASRDFAQILHFRWRKAEVPVIVLVQRDAQENAVIRRKNFS